MATVPVWPEVWREKDVAVDGDLISKNGFQLILNVCLSMTTIHSVWYGATMMLIRWIQRGIGYLSSTISQAAAGRDASDRFPRARESQDKIKFESESCGGFRRTLTFTVFSSYKEANAWPCRLADQDRDACF